MREIPFDCVNDSGQRLYGVAHLPTPEPAADQPRIGVNIIVPGVKYRVAPNRLSVKIARRLCSEGFYVLRCDPCGVGESDGDIGNNRRLKEIFTEIQEGRFVADTVAAQNHFIKTFALKTSALLGNCGGAATACLAHARSESRHLVLIDLPIALSTDTSSFKQAALRGGGYSDNILSGYLKKAFSLKSWKRFLTFQSEYTVIFSLLKRKLKKGLEVGASTSTNRKMSEFPDFSASGEPLNKALFKAFDDFASSGGKAICLCAEYDASTPLLDQYFMPFFADANVEKAVIDKANHIYTNIDAQTELIGSIAGWMKRMFPEVRTHSD